jgi:hypothetical protein
VPETLARDIQPNGCYRLHGLSPSWRAYQLTSTGRVHPIRSGQANQRVIFHKACKISILEDFSKDDHTRCGRCSIFCLDISSVVDISSHCSKKLAEQRSRLLRVCFLQEFAQYCRHAKRISKKPAAIKGK